MGWRQTIVFQPLIGEKYFISEFKKNNHFEKRKNCWVYTQYKGDTIEMCHEIANAFPGITFYGYRIEDTTCGQWFYRQVMFNKQDGVIFLGKNIYTADDEVRPIFDGLSIRGKQWGRYNCDTNKYEIEIEEDNNEDGGYCEERN
jgi:hypothetical protein